MVTRFKVGVFPRGGVYLTDPTLPENYQHFSAECGDPNPFVVLAKDHDKIVTDLKQALRRAMEQIGVHSKLYKHCESLLIDN